MTVEEYNRIYSIESLDDSHIHIMTHSLGIEQRITNKRATKADAYRNYFTGKVYKPIQELIDLKFMKEIRPEYFVVTKAGVLWLQNHFQKVIHFRDFEDVYE